MLGSRSYLCVFLGFLLFSSTTLAQLPDPLGPMPEPPENPLTVEGAILGKFLFWEEQLSSDNAVACGTCHKPFRGGAEARVSIRGNTNPGARNPGHDMIFGIADDVVGSIGVVRSDSSCELFEDNIFLLERQVTERNSPSFIAAGYAPDTFWDGHATSEFIDPETGTIAIVSGGALESQAVSPVLSSVEMACEDRSWDDVRNKLQTVQPMALATDLPGEMLNALSQFPTYPDLFENAFGTPEINARRIAFAIASYQRTLVPDRTPLDLYLKGDLDALTKSQQDGMRLFLDNCAVCHAGPELSDHVFHNIGVRPADEDIGREAVTGDPADRGKMKTPPLRNVGLRAPHFHNGGKLDLDEVLAFYNRGGDFDGNLDPLMIQADTFTESELLLIKDFLENGLTDPRVASEQPPFDRPQLQPYFYRGDANHDLTVDIADVIFNLGYLFSEGQAPSCLDAADTNDDGAINIADPIYVLYYLFAGVLFTDTFYGPDLTPDDLGCSP